MVLHSAKVRVNEVRLLSLLGDVEIGNPWGPQKSVPKTPCYSDILRCYRINGRKCKSEAEHSRSYLASLKKGLIFSREARKCAGEDKAFLRFMRHK